MSQNSSVWACSQLICEPNLACFFLCQLVQSLGRDSSTTAVVDMIAWATCSCGLFVRSIPVFTNVDYNKFNLKWIVDEPIWPWPGGSNRKPSSWWAVLAPCLVGHLISYGPALLKMSAIRAIFYLVHNSTLQMALPQNLRDVHCIFLSVFTRNLTRCISHQISLKP